MIEVAEVAPGVVSVTIQWAAYGSTGAHWRDVLGSPGNPYDPIFIYRAGAAEARRTATEGLAGFFSAGEGVDIDECPGAMFDWNTSEPADSEPCDAYTNRALGRDLGNALRKYPDFTQVVFRFVT